MARPHKLTPQPERRQLQTAVKQHDRGRQKLINAVRAAKAAGGGIADIAELTGRSTNTIQRWLKAGE